MLRELLQIFRSDNPLVELAENFAEMLKRTRELTTRSGIALFDKPATPEERTWIYKHDVKVNKLERAIRKRVISHLSITGNAADVPYCLMLMSLVKDAERIGDYAKNLSEIRELHPDPLPEDEIVAELRELRLGVEGVFEETSEVFATSDRDAANELIRQGRELSHRADALFTQIARSDYNAATTTAVVLGTRYYKRIGGHLLNVLSSVVMPLHKLDYYDEKQLTPPGET
jgi:phosphate transport system protein